VYEVVKQNDNRWAIQDATTGKVYGISNDYAVALRERRRLNGEAAPPVVAGALLDGPGVVVCVGCHDEVQPGSFYYIINKRIVCEACREKVLPLKA
jgi:hypothetical protein